MIDEDYELFSRHVSLPEIGAPGVERLLATKVAIADDVPARTPLVLALARAGLEVVSAGADVAIESAALSPAGVIDFSEGHVDVGPFDFAAAGRIEASAPLKAKELWLGALIASELVLFLLQRRPEAFTLACYYPHYSVRS